MQSLRCMIMGSVSGQLQCCVCIQIDICVCVCGWGGNRYQVLYIYSWLFAQTFIALLCACISAGCVQKFFRCFLFSTPIHQAESEEKNRASAPAKSTASVTPCDCLEVIGMRSRSNILPRNKRFLMPSSGIHSFTHTF
jgi:hypothetical protein